MKYHAYLINLDNSHERLNAASTQLTQAGFEFTRVPAFDGRQLNPKDAPDYDSKGAHAYMGRALKGGELGIYYSHMDCARRFLESNADYGIVFEDDVQIREHTKSTIEHIIHILEQEQCDWYLLNIGAEKQKIYSTLHTVGEHQLVRAHYFPMTATGLVWTRQGAQAFLDAHTRIFAPVDNYFRHWLTRNNKGLAVLPSLVVASGVPSEVDNTALRKLTERSHWYGLAKQRRLWTDKLIALFHKHLG